MNEAQGPPGHSASVVNDPQLAEVVAQQLEAMLAASKEREKQARNARTAAEHALQKSKAKHEVSFCHFLNLIFIQID